jgi:diguanylate cyclase
VAINTTTEQKNQKTGGAQDIAVQALDRIEAQGLKPIPQLYELFYRYYQGDPEIVRAIDLAGNALDEVACHKIYKRFLSDTARDEAVRKISEQIQQSVGELVTMLLSAKSATSDYDDTLKIASQQIQGAKSLEDLGTIVSFILEDTKEMLEKNQALEVQLVNSSQQVTELRKNLDNVKKEAMTDKYIRDYVDEAHTTGLPLTVLMLDIDHFKKFNDSFGHLVGDQVLRLVARTLTDGVKGRDVAARYGGEEFSIILPETPLQAGLKVAEMLRRSVEGKEVINKANQEHMGQITLSIGVAEYHGRESVSDFVQRADNALYEAKHAGRNRVLAAPVPG